MFITLIATNNILSPPLGLKNHSADREDGEEGKQNGPGKTAH